jgi:hypothetical protein
MHKAIVLGLALTGAALCAGSAEAQVSINLNIAPPPIVFKAPPRVVAIPQTPVAQVADTSFNVFFYGGRYYSHHNGSWFISVSHGGPWAFVPQHEMPRQVLVVPARFYKIKPGHGKKHAHWHHDHDRKHGRRDHDHDRHHGRGRGRDRD